MSARDSVKGTPCETAIERAIVLAHKIVNGEVGPFDGGRQIAWLGSGDCFDFINEVDVVDEMAGFWQLVADPEQRHAIALPPIDNRAELAEEIRRAARALIESFGPKN